MGLSFREGQGVGLLLWVSLSLYFFTSFMASS